MNEIKDAKVDYGKLYKECVVLGFRNFLTSEDFLRNFKWILDNMDERVYYLTEDEKKILNYRYIEKLTLIEIGNKLGKSKSYVRYWRKKAIEILNRYISTEIVTNPLAVGILKQKNLRNKPYLKILYKHALQHKISLCQFLIHSRTKSEMRSIELSYLDDNREMYIKFACDILAPIALGINKFDHYVALFDDKEDYDYLMEYVIG